MLMMLLQWMPMPQIIVDRRFPRRHPLLVMLLSKSGNIGIPLLCQSRERVANRGSRGLLQIVLAMNIDSCHVRTWSYPQVRYSPPCSIKCKNGPDSLYFVMRTCGEHHTLLHLSRYRIDCLRLPAIRPSLLPYGIEQRKYTLWRCSQVNILSSGKMLSYEWHNDHLFFL